jgi:hypothetical protein
LPPPYPPTVKNMKKGKGKTKRIKGKKNKEEKIK